MLEFLHARRDFGQLVSLVAAERRVDPVLVEKDYSRARFFRNSLACGMSTISRGSSS